MDDQLQKPKTDPKFIEVVDQEYIFFLSSISSIYASMRVVHRQCYWNS